jgi:putative drug exporter of the RND superfamily
VATFLERIGRFAFLRRCLVSVVWVVLLAAFAVSALTLAKPTATSFSVPGTESQRALDVLAERFPALGVAGASARVVIQAPEGQELASDENRAKVRELVAQVADSPQVAMAIDPWLLGTVDPSGTMAYIQVSYAVPTTSVSDEARAALEAVATAGREAGLTVEVGGDALMALPALGGEEILGVLVAAVVLVITLGSLVAAGLPLVMALFGVGIGVAAVAIASHVTEISTYTSTLALMLGLAVAIDYSLFIVSRYRHELALGRDPCEAVGRAVTTAGSAVVFAGSTVVVALLALAVVGIPLLTQIGIAAAFTVAVSVLVALTLLPALLGFVGARVRPARDPEGDGTGPGAASRWARFLVRHPIPVVVVATAALLLVAVPALQLRLGLPDDSTASPSTTQRQAYDLLSQGFGPGVNGPLVIVLDATSTADPEAALERATASVGALPGVADVSFAMFDKTGEKALFQVVPASGPSDAATQELVAAIRSASTDLEVETGATLAVTGRTALNIDISARMRDALAPYLAVVVGLALLLLAVVFRSFLVPIKATLGFVLSLAATFGAVVAVFQWGWLGWLFGIQETGPILSLLPIIVVGVVFGLAMDYEVFLVTRMREEHVHGAGPTDAVVAGFSHGGRVVTAAAIIMISVFAGFILSPDPMIKSLGFALAAAVLFDAFVVRMTIVPAVMAIAGHRAWWLPRWLERFLPSFDLESGERVSNPAAQ